ncbi:unnamed protein product [Rotaria sp. Silwood2]|nr:unnamed protein product [Rotaria sp. Silwood2]
MSHGVNIRTVSGNKHNPLLPSKFQRVQNRAAAIWDAWNEDGRGLALEFVPHLHRVSAERIYYDIYGNPSNVDKRFGIEDSTKLKRTLNRIDPIMPDSMKVQYLMAGVKESLKLHITLYDPQTTESFLSYARKAEDTLSFTDVNYEINQYNEYQGVAAIQQYLPKPNTFHKQRNSYSRNDDQHPKSHTSQSYGKHISLNKNFFYLQIAHVMHRQNNHQLSAMHVVLPANNARDCTRSHFD